MKICHIVGFNKNRVIGLDGKMPWHHSEDLKYFKRVTMGHPVIMGRKTFESIGKPLPGRVNIVLTRNKDFSSEGIEVFQDFDSAIAYCQEKHGHVKDSKAFVIGGGELYKQTLDQADMLFITNIDSDEEGDTFYPEWDKEDFVCVESFERPKLTFNVFERTQA